jgi:hypothetical protein
MQLLPALWDQQRNEQLKHHKINCHIKLTKPTSDRTDYRQFDASFKELDPLC